MSRSPRLEPEELPCDQKLLVHRTVCHVPPVRWISERRSCEDCKTGFDVSAREQQFWYERLRIPYDVRINRCPTCRRDSRVHRRIIARLSELLPLVDNGEADEQQRRLLVLTIHEGMRRKIPGRHAIPILKSEKIIATALSVIAALRKRSRRHDDLVVLQIDFHERVGHHEKMLKLRMEQAAIITGSPAMERAVRAMVDWVATPTAARWRAVCEIA